MSQQVTIKDCFELPSWDAKIEPENAVKKQVSSQKSASRGSAVMFELTPGKLTSNSKKALEMPACKYEVTMAVKEARFYDPDLGRFLQVDPAYETWSPYFYAKNNPVFYTDPTGKYSAVEVSHMEARKNFIQGNTARGYMWLGMSGFCTMTDSLSRVFDHHFIKERDDVTGWTYAGAVLNIADVIPIAKFASQARHIKKLWNLGPVIRGVEIEKLLYGASRLLPSGFKTIDVFQKGTAISIKSLDTSAKTYQNTKQLATVVKGYINKLAKFKGYTKQGVEVTEDMIQSRRLDLIITKGATSKEQFRILEEMTEFGQEVGVDLIIKEL